MTLHSSGNDIVHFIKHAAQIGKDGTTNGKAIAWVDGWSTRSVSGLLGCASCASRACQKLSCCCACFTRVLRVALLGRLLLWCVAGERRYCATAARMLPISASKWA